MRNYLRGIGNNFHANFISFCILLMPCLDLSVLPIFNTQIRDWFFLTDNDPLMISRLESMRSISEAPKSIGGLGGLLHKGIKEMLFLILYVRV